MTPNNKFKTTVVYVSGAICGHMWMPAVKGGIPFHGDVRQQLRRYSEKGASLRDVLNSFLMENGGDFQDSRFTADTVVRIERRRVDGIGKYTMHTKERELSEFSNCADLVDNESYVGDFLGEDY